VLETAEVVAMDRLLACESSLRTEKLPDAGITVVAPKHHAEVDEANPIITHKHITHNTHNT
jgi:hypothetical protein